VSEHDYVVALRGEDEDLNFLSKCYTDETCRVVREGNSWELRSSQFRLPEDREELPVADYDEDHADGEGERGHEIKLIYSDRNYETVQDRAIEMINAMIGAARLVRGDINNVLVTSITKYSLAGDRVGVAASAHGWLSPIKNVSIPAERSGLPELMRAWVNTGLDDTTVKAILQIYAVLPMSWSRCVVVIEFVSADCGGEKNLTRFISKKQLSLITSSAHNARVIEEGPRHGKRVPKDWDADRALSLLDADSLVKQLVHRWLAVKTGMHRIPKIW
jgi:hypothetical protein